MNKEYYVLYSNCPITLGSKYAIICDLFRYRFKLLPTPLAILLIENERRYLDDIVSNFKSVKDFSKFMAFIDVLKKEDYLQLTSFPDNDCWGFWDNTSRINLYQTNAKLIVGSAYDIKTAIDKLSSIGIQYLLIEFLNSENLIQDLAKISSAVGDTSICYIGVIIRGKLVIDTYFIDAINGNKRFSEFYAVEIERNLQSKIKWCNFFEYSIKSEPQVEFFVHPMLYNHKQENYYSKILTIKQNGEISFE